MSCKSRKPAKHALTTSNWGNQIFVFFSRITSRSPRDITFHVDYSDINLVYNVIETISKKINLRSQALTETLTSDLLDRIGKTQSVIDERLATLTDLTK